MGVHSATEGKALNYGLDFVGGTSTTADYGKDYMIEDIENTIVPVVADVASDNDIMARTKWKEQHMITVKTRTLSLDERYAEDTLVDQLVTWMNLPLHHRVSVRTIGNECVPMPSLP